MIRSESLWDDEGNSPPTFLGCPTEQQMFPITASLVFCDYATAIPVVLLVLSCGS